MDIYMFAPSARSAKEIARNDRFLSSVDRTENEFMESNMFFVSHSQPLRATIL